MRKTSQSTHCAYFPAAQSAMWRVPVRMTDRFFGDYCLRTTLLGQKIAFARLGPRWRRRMATYTKYRNQWYHQSDVTHSGPGLDHGVGHPIRSALAHCSSRWPEGGWRGGDR